MASRAERKALKVPEGVKVAFAGNDLTVEGPNGRLTHTFPEIVRITYDGAGREISLGKVGESRFARAMVGTVRSLIANMLVGVVSGFAKDLEISGVGFKATVKGDTLDLALGTSHPILYPIPAGVRVGVTGGVKVHVEGADRQKVGQVAADIFSFYPVEPYKGKGVHIVGRFVRRKEGKKTA